MRRHYIHILLLLLFAATACKKPKPVDPITDRPAPEDSIQYDGHLLNLSIKNMVGDREMIFKTSLDSGATYYNYLGEPFQIKRYVYYISNPRLISTTGDTLSLYPAYHIVDATQGIYNASFKTMKGTYRELIFAIGVDSARNVSGIQTGALDPFWGLFWDWNTGYVMATFEGTSPLAPYGTFFYHIGGYAGEYNAVRPVSIRLDEPFSTTDKNIDLQLTADALKWFNAVHPISIPEVNSVVTIGPSSKKLADNYAKMFVKYEIQ